MEKKQFFKELNSSLGSKYNLTSKQIGTIRSFYLSSNMTRKEIAMWLGNKLSVSQRSILKKEHFQQLINFVASCSDEAWDDITQKTEYDRVKNRTVA